MNTVRKQVLTIGLLAVTAAVSASAGVNKAVVAGTAAQVAPAAPAPPGPGATPPAEAPKPRLRTRTVERVHVSGGSYMGVHTQDVTADRVKELKLREERGVEITMVDQDAPAGKAGLKEHDVVLEFNGTRVEGQEQLKRLIRETPPGRAVTLGIMRNGAPQSVQVQLAERKTRVVVPRVRVNPNVEVVIPDFPDMPEIPEAPGVMAYSISSSGYRLGVQVEPLTRQLGEFFGVRDGEGLLVRSVEKGSPAESGGMKAGDVIVRVGQEKVENRTDLRRSLRKFDEGGSVNITVIREKREVVLGVNLPKQKDRRQGFIFGEDEDFDFDFQFDFDGEELERSLRRIEPRMRHMTERIARLAPEVVAAAAPAIDALDTDSIRRAVEEAVRATGADLY